MARDPYEVVLADLRAKRDEIDRLIRSLEVFRPAPTASAQTATQAPTAALGGAPYRGKSIVDAAHAALKTNGTPMGTAEIATAIQDGGLVMNSVEPTNTVSSVLHRAFQAGGSVVKVGRGRWGLIEWKQPAEAIEGDEAVPPDLLSADEVLGIERIP